MKFDESVLSGTEKLVNSLKSLYVKYGYRQYRMSKFEEYALYGRNIDFLVSDSVITFTDTDGKLMALKPDVTLSIVKNDRDDNTTVNKVCYNENVYRVSKGTGAFKEIMQSGIECIGDVDVCLVGEVLSLASKSLEATGEKYVLEVSHLGLLSLAVGKITGEPGLRNRIMKCVSEKNIHGISELCRDNSIDADAAAPLVSLVSLYGKPSKVLEKIKEIDLGEEGKEALSEFSLALSVFDGDAACDSVQIDMSVTADENYYNGIVFKGFVEGVPESVLSGGQYDRLMNKMGRRSRAVGFAVYLDALEMISSKVPEYDFDVMLIYPDGMEPSELRAETEKIVGSGRSVFCCKRPNDKIKCKETVRI